MTAPALARPTLAGRSTAPRLALAPVSFGTTITRLRRRRGMSQLACAQLMGRTENWLSKVENDRIPVDRLSVLCDLARVLGVDIHTLVEAAL